MAVYKSSVFFIGLLILVNKSVMNKEAISNGYFLHCILQPTASNAIFQLWFSLPHCVVMRHRAENTSLLALSNKTQGRKYLLQLASGFITALFTKIDRPIKKTE